MDFNTVKFVRSYARAEDLPQASLREIVFVGKSNVGKSTLINSLCKRKKLVKTSSIPGKTRLINFFVVGEGMNCFYLVDMPGYGFAKVSQSEKQKWKDLIDGYFLSERNIALVCCLIDIRHDPTVLDKQMHEFVKSTGLPFCVILTKADKISNQKCQLCTRKIQEILGIPEGFPIIVTSSQSRLGMKKFENIIFHYLGL